MTKDVTKNIDIKRYISWKKIVKGKPIHIRLYELVYKAISNEFRRGIFSD